MTCRVRALCIAATDPQRLAGFWSALLGWPQIGTTLDPQDDTGFQIRFLPTDEPKTVANQLHFDLTSTSLEDQQATVAKALALGARHHDVGQRGDEGHVVLADPEGNELCVIEPGNRFLADCGFIGALSCDGSQAVGYFWSAALGWPLVWDQDEETAIRSPHGGPKVTWGGPPLPPKTGPYRLHFDLLPDGDAEAEVARLVSLGASVVEDAATHLVMLDPDGHEFWVQTVP